MSSLSSSDDSLELSNPKRRRLVTLRGLDTTASIAPLDEGGGGGGSSAADLAITGLPCLEWSRDEAEEEAEASASTPP